MLLTYYLRLCGQFLDPVCACVEMLMDHSIASHDNFIWTSSPTRGIYGELNTGWFWRHAELESNALACGYFIMPLIFFMDGSNPDFRQNSQLKPIYVACGNYKGRVIRSRKGKRCIGYFKKLKVSFG